MKRINLGILAHVDAGKTTLTESILYHTGVIQKKGRVDKGTTISDSMEIEQKRGMSVRSSTVSFTHNKVKVNLIDTPGHMDFIAEVERSLFVLDLVILVISAKEGVQPQTRVLFHKLSELKIPTILYINKVDRMGVNLDILYQDIKNQLTTNILQMQMVHKSGLKDFSIHNLDFNHDSVMETVLLLSDRLMEQYLDNQTISTVEYERKAMQLFNQGLLYPLYHGSALNDIGTVDIMNACIHFYYDTKINQQELCAYVYKVEWDNKNHKRIYIRIFDGSIAVKQRIHVIGLEEPIVINSLRKVQGVTMLPTNHLIAGDIGILLDVEQLKVGDFLGKSKEKSSLELARPLLTVSVSPKNTEQRTSLIHALKQLAVEDPLLEMKIHQVTNEIQLKLFGSLQIDILSNLLLNRYQIEADFGDVCTIYKEQPSKSSQATIWIGEQGNIYHAGVSIRIEPMDLGSGFQYENKVSYGYLEKSFQNAVLDGIKEGLAQGLNNREIIDVRVTFEDAYYDSVCGTPADFRKLTPLVVAKALEQSTLYELEPWLTYKLKAPLGNEKQVMSDIFKMQGNIDTVTYNNDTLIVSGLIPYDTTKDYAFELLSFTEGKGDFQTKFYRYMPRTPLS